MVSSYPYTASPGDTFTFDTGVVLPDIPNNTSLFNGTGPYTVNIPTGFDTTQDNESIIFDGGGGSVTVNFADNTDLSTNNFVATNTDSLTMNMGDGSSVHNITLGSTVGDFTLNAGDDVTVNRINSSNITGSSNISFGNNSGGFGPDVSSGDGDDTWTFNGDPDVGVGSGDRLEGNGGTDTLIFNNLPPDQQATLIANLTAAGWTDNGDGTWSGTTDFVGPQNWLDIRDFENVTITICFADKTLIKTEHGQVKAGDLVVGDRVATADNGFQEIRWINTQTLGAATLAANPNLRPIRITAGALGLNLPARDLLVSQQHRMMVSNKVAQRMFGEDEVLVPAKQLLQIDGIDIADDVEEVTYVHFLCAQHEIVFAEGAPSETLYTGKMALQSVGEEARQEIFTLFPELLEMDPDTLPVSARSLVKPRRARQMANRLMRNSQPLLGHI